MRCLGIPNTAHFANVTNIEDARARESCDCHVTCEPDHVISSSVGETQDGKS